MPTLSLIFCGVDSIAHLTSQFLVWLVMLHCGYTEMKMCPGGGGGSQRLSARGLSRHRLPWGRHASQELSSSKMVRNVFGVEVNGCLATQTRSGMSEEEREMCTECVNHVRLSPTYGAPNRTHTVGQKLLSTVRRDGEVFGDRCLFLTSNISSNDGYCSWSAGIHT